MKLINDCLKKNSEIINIKNQFNLNKNKIRELINDNQLKGKEIENKKNEINNLKEKINQLLIGFEKEKKEKEDIQKLYEKNLPENNKNYIENIKSLENRLDNISSFSYKLIFTKHIPKFKLTWFLITDKNENEKKNYINTFWVSGEKMQQIKDKLNFENSNTDIDDGSENINDIKKYKEDIKKLNNIIIEKDKSRCLC